MKIYHLDIHRTTLLGAALLAMSLAACGESDDLRANLPSTGAGTRYVSLSFTMPAEEETSRAGNPLGGENDDEPEQGQDNENTISSAVAFFFQNQGAGANGSADTPVSYMYFDSFKEYTEGTTPIDRVYTTNPVSTNLYGRFNILVVANPGTDRWWTTTTTLGSVRDHLLTRAWTESDGNYSDFAMASAKDATIEITDDNNTVTAAANTTVDVERVAARVDYKTLNSYTREDPAFEGATVVIESAILVNDLTAPGSYTLKRVAATTDGAVTYLGDETLGADGLPSNWVIDPTTSDKARASFGVSWSDPEAGDPNWWSGKGTTGKQVTIGNETWNILGYTLENITNLDQTKHEYNTAVVFKAKFTPAQGSVAHYQAGNTFFAYGNTIYASMEDMMTDFNQRPTADMDAAINNCVGWNDVTDFARTLHDGDPCGYKAWLQEQIDEGKSLDAVKASLTWTSYMRSEFGYSATLGADDIYTVSIDQDNKKTAELLAEKGTRVYEDATCYYTWWIRHANDGNDDTNGVMEYAIVRNNIYKLDVEKVYSLGGYIPNEEEHGFIVNVYVKDWEMLKPEKIEM